MTLKTAQARIARGFFAFALAIVLTGCVGVKLTAEGAQVRQATAEETRTCTVVGKVTSSIPSKTLNRLAPNKIQEQLIVMARNEAVGFGGNTVAPAGPVANGTQEFTVLRCP
jgi:hypothetical protein